MNARPLFSSFSSIQHQEKKTIYPRRESRWQWQHYTRQLQWSSRWQFWILWRSSSVTNQERNGEAAINRFVHLNRWITSCGNRINSNIGATPRSWASTGLWCLGGGGWTQARATGIQEGIWFSIQTVESAHKCVYFLEEGSKWSRWAIGRMESCKSVAIWALGWQCGRPHCQRGIQHPDSAFRRSSDGHGRCKAYSYQLCNLCESLCQECNKDHPDS